MEAMKKHDISRAVAMCMHMLSAHINQYTNSSTGKKIVHPHTHAHYYNAKLSDDGRLWLGLQTA